MGKTITLDDFDNAVPKVAGRIMDIALENDDEDVKGAFDKALLWIAFGSMMRNELFGAEEE